MKKHFKKLNLKKLNCGFVQFVDLNFSPKNRQNFTLRAMWVIITLSLLIYFILIVTHRFDASFAEKFRRYPASREGRMVVAIYITLVIFTLIITFWKQTVLITKFQLSIIKKVSKFTKSQLPAIKKILKKK